MNTTDGTMQYFDLLKSALCASLYDESAWQVSNSTSVERRPSLLRSPVAALQERFLGLLRSKGFLVIWPKPFAAEERQEGLDWPLFGYTMTGRVRLDVLQTLLQDVLVRGVPGDIVETGVWRGGSMILAQAVLLSQSANDRRVWLADSFEGMPKPQTDLIEADLSADSYLAVSVEQVQENFRRFNLFGDNLRFLKGWFSDTLPDAPIERIALLRLDGDLYHSTMDALSSLYQKVSPNGYVIVDDYSNWEGCKKAVDEFRAKNAITAAINRIDQHAVYWQVAA